MSLYTKHGRPLDVSGGTVYSASGAVIGRIRGNKIFGPDGRYVGTIDGDRLVHRSTDSAVIGSPFAAADRPDRQEPMPQAPPFGAMSPTYLIKRQSAELRLVKKLALPG